MRRVPFVQTVLGACKVVDGACYDATSPSRFAAWRAVVAAAHHAMVGSLRRPCSDAPSLLTDRGVVDYLTDFLQTKCQGWSTAATQT